ncbi:unnamed protein product [Mytilus coruscus]|uniref:Uncharacterized protein n=1 Tax=Mytilus coruscus TaxID=42192 RepID=A0A6J8AKH8_MYTCO|nr:unnamed protein product [Mytilus coruscus]
MSVLVQPICDCRCDTKEDLAKHVDTYPVHKNEVNIQKTSGITINPESFFGHSEMPYFISSDDIIAYNKEKSREHYMKKRRENGKTAAQKVEECLNIPEANISSSQIIAVLPSSQEKDEMGEYDAVTVVSGDLENTEEVNVAVIESTRSESGDSSSTTSTSSSNSSSKVHIDHHMQNFTKQLNKNLEEA